jgi:hypothetical protein
VHSSPQRIQLPRQSWRTILTKGDPHSLQAGISQLAKTKPCNWYYLLCSVNIMLPAGTVVRPVFLINRCYAPPFNQHLQLAVIGSAPIASDRASSSGNRWLWAKTHHYIVCTRFIVSNIRFNEPPKRPTKLIPKISNYSKTGNSLPALGFKFTTKSLVAPPVSHRYPLCTAEDSTTSQ